MFDKHEHREAVTALVALACESTNQHLERVAEMFERPLLRDEFFTGAMIGAILRDCKLPTP